MADSTTTQSPADFNLSNLPADSMGHMMVNLNIALIVISTVFISLRLYVRGFMVKAIGVDDVTALLAFGFVATLSAFEIDSVYYGSGTHIEEVPPERLQNFFSNLVTSQLLFFWSTAIVRLSIATFYPRLSNDRMFRRCVYAVAGLILAITLAAFIFELAECKHLPDLWNINAPGRQCLDKAYEAPMMWTHGAVGILTDMCLVALPIWVIYSKMKFSVKTVQVILVFCVGIVGIVTGIIRLSLIVSTDFTTDTTFKMARVAPWTDLEGHLGLWTGCFPALQPLLRLVSYKLGLRSSPESSDRKSRTTHPSQNGATASKHRASTNQSSWKGRSKGYVSFDAGKDDSDSSRVFVQGGSFLKDAEDKDLEMEEYDLESGKRSNSSSHTTGIHKRTDVRVTIDSADVESPRQAHKKWNAV